MGVPLPLLRLSAALRATADVRRGGAGRGGPVRGELVREARAVVLEERRHSRVAEAQLVGAQLIRRLADQG